LRRRRKSAVRLRHHSYTLFNGIPVLFERCHQSLPPFTKNANISKTDVEHELSQACFPRQRKRQEKRVAFSGELLAERLCEEAPHWSSFCVRNDAGGNAAFWAHDTAKLGKTQLWPMEEHETQVTEDRAKSTITKW